MIRRTLLTLLLMAIGGCVTVATAPEPDRHAGFFESGFEVEAFHPCKVDEAWWVTGAEALRQRYREVASAPYQRVYVELRGTTGPAGRFGHMGAYARELSVDEVLLVRPARQEDCD